MSPSRSSPPPLPPVDPAVPGLRRLLGAAATVAMALATAGALVPGPLGRAGAAGAVATIVATPLLRVMALVGHWYRGHDRRFAGVGLALMAVVAAGAALAAL